MEIFSDKWKMPESFTMLQFVVRVGNYGGYMIVETDKPTDIHYFTSVFAALEITVEPVVDVMDAVAVEKKPSSTARKTPRKRRRGSPPEWLHRTLRVSILRISGRRVD